MPAKNSLMKKKAPSRKLRDVRYELVEGVVWCNKLGEIHDDELDPYMYGPPEPGHDDDRCKPEDHEKVYKPKS